MIEIAIVAGLILLNGVFALSELAVVSSRKPLLKSMAERKRSGAAAALELAENPGRFLSTVQIGITLIGVGTGAFSGATIGGNVTDAMLGWGIPASLAPTLGYGGVVALITYLSVVIGELVPKQLALRNAENIACIIGPFMKLLATIATPLAWLLDASTRTIFRLIGLSDVAENLVTEEEIKSMVNEAAESGVIESEEKRMIAGVLRLSDGNARTVMTPRTDVDWIDLTDTPEAIRAQLVETRHSRLPVADGDPDNIIGVVVIRECLSGNIPQNGDELRAKVHKVPVIPDTLGALEVLERLRESEHPIALVHDEYGHFEGVVTPNDMLEAIAGFFRSDLDDEEADEAIQREDGSWLISGGLPADAMADVLDIELPNKRDYQTVAGYVINELEHLPEVGEVIIADGWMFEVVDLDGRRIDKVLVSKATSRDGESYE